MKKSLNLIFSLLLIVSIVGASPIILERYNTEQSNKNYQIALHNNDIQMIGEDEKKMEFYNLLKDTGVDTITFENLSIDNLSKYKDIKYMTVEDYVKDKDDFNYKVNGFIPKYALKDNIIIMLSKDDFLEDEIELIKQFLHPDEILEQGNDIVFYIDEPIEVVYKDNKSTNYLITSKFFIDKSAIQEAVDNGFKPMLTISNSQSGEIQDIVFKQIMNLSDEFGINKIQSKGSQIIGHPTNTTQYLEEFKSNNIDVITTEFDTKLGLNPYLENGQNTLIRGHEIALNHLKLSKEEFSARISRAVRERNIRVVIVKDFIDYRNIATIHNSMYSVVDSLKDTEAQLSNGYSLSEATNYSIIDRKQGAEIFVALGSASIVGLLMLSITNDNKISYILSLVCAITVFMGAFVINKLQIGIGIKAYALGISILGACAAIIVPYKSNIKSVLAKFILTGLLATITGLIVASIMYGTDYLLKLSEFSGVKLLYVAPPVLVTLWVILESNILTKFHPSNISNTLTKKNIKKAIKSIKWYHIVLLILVLVGGFVYITRSGNNGSVSELELAFRQKLEEILQVRPRTKEFMLGYPAVLLALYMYKNNIKYAKYMLIPASIATMSTVNTFTHLHTPLIYSLIRTAYGIGIGFVVGLIYILIFNKIKKFIIKES